MFVSGTILSSKQFFFVCLLDTTTGWKNKKCFQVTNLSHSHPTPAPPMIRLSVNDTVVVDPGQDLQLSCDITAGFPAPTVTWVRYPGPLPLSALVRGPMLILRAVTPADAGFYNCTAVNNVGNPARKNVNVIVRSEYQPVCSIICSHFNLPQLKKMLWTAIQDFGNAGSIVMKLLKPNTSSKYQVDVSGNWFCSNRFYWGKSYLKWLFTNQSN